MPLNPIPGSTDQVSNESSSIGDLESKIKAYNKEQNVITHFLSHRQLMSISSMYTNRLLRRYAASTTPKKTPEIKKRLNGDTGDKLNIKPQQIEEPKPVKIVENLEKTEEKSPATAVEVIKPIKIEEKPIISDGLTIQTRKNFVPPKPTQQAATTSVRKQQLPLKSKQMEDYFDHITKDQEEQMKELQKLKEERLRAEAQEHQRWIDEFSEEFAGHLSDFLTSSEGAAIIRLAKSVEDLSDLILSVVALTLNEDMPDRKNSKLNLLQRYMISVSDNMADWLESIVSDEMRC